MIKSTKFGALKSLAIAGFVGACSVGISQGAVTLNIFENVNGVNFVFDGGTLITTDLVMSGTVPSSSADLVTAGGSGFYGAQGSDDMDLSLIHI